MAETRLVAISDEQVETLRRIHAELMGEGGPVLRSIVTAYEEGITEAEARDLSDHRVLAKLRSAFNQEDTDG